MRKFVFGLLLASVAAGGAWAANVAEYLGINIDANINGRVVAQKAIIEPGKKIRFISKGNDISQPSIRLDYIVDDINVAENGEAVANISGMVFLSEGDGTWILANDFKSVVKIGNPAFIKKSSPRHSTDININITPISKKQMLEKFGGQIPPSSSCNDQSSLLEKSLAKNGDENCCVVKCKNGSGSTMVCCGAIKCCDDNGGEDCCCAP